MKTTTLPSAVLVLALLTACMPQRKPGEYVHLYGDPAPPAATERTIVIHPDTRHINVEGGEAVRFVVDGRAFGWHFNVARTVSVFDLAEVAPPGTLTRSLPVYVSPDPRYFSVP